MTKFHGRHNPIANQLNPRVESEELDLVQDREREENVISEKESQTQNEEETHS